MNGHPFSMKNKTNTPVGMHFSTEGHNPRVSVIQKAPQDILQRRLLEKCLIDRLKKSPGKLLLNRDDGPDIRVL